MRTLVVGDVHGCRDELDALLQCVGADRVFLVGDLFTKGPDPVGVWRLIRQENLDSILGNHDVRLLETRDGLRPQDQGAAQVLTLLDRADETWEPWLRSRSLFGFLEPFTVVHASLHPSGDLQQTTRQMALYWRRWPGDASEASPWYQSYFGERKVIFGHDARGGLIRRERGGYPWIIGLDTGCVYGGKLSGYILEEDRIVQVKARQVYKSF